MLFVAAAFAGSDQRHPRELGTTSPVLYALNSIIARATWDIMMRSRLFRVADIGRCLAYRMVKGTSITSNGEIA
jgi:hypothetical protein